MQSNKDGLALGSLLGNNQVSQIMTVLWELRSGGAPNPVCLPPVTARLLLFRATMELAMEWGQGSLKHHKIHSLLLLRFSHFNCTNMPQITTCLWLISRILKKLLLIIFAGFPITLMGRIIRGASALMKWFTISVTLHFLPQKFSTQF